jgi:hypothetical protein
MSREMTQPSAAASVRVAKRLRAAEGRPDEHRERRQVARSWGSRRSSLRSGVLSGSSEAMQNIDMKTDQQDTRHDGGINSLATESSVKLP